jgi:uncharacterized membrane protein YkvA (DUF1232 family)
MSDNKTSISLWASVVRRFSLGWRLLWDPRVSLWVKLAPFFTVLYIISPLDFIPDVILGVGQVDDLGALLVGLELFIRLTPEGIVMQHLQAMGFDVGQWEVVDEEMDLIEGEYEVKEE